jgi:hypothetical protein
MQTEVRVFQKPSSKTPKEPPTPVGTRRVDLPVGTLESDDAARQIVRDAIADFGKVQKNQVTVNHQASGGFVAYLPAKE